MCVASFGDRTLGLPAPVDLELHTHTHTPRAVLERPSRAERPPPGGTAHQCLQPDCCGHVVRGDDLRSDEATKGRRLLPAADETEA